MIKIHNTKSGHLYFAQKRTFLFCLDTVIIRSGDKKLVLLSIFSAFDNNQTTYFVMALTILDACASISPSSELSEKLATCSYKPYRSSWS